EGISKSGDALDLGVEANVVEKSGAWYTYNGERIGQGRETARVYLKDHPEAMAEIERKVLLAKGVVREAPAADAAKPGKPGEAAPVKAETNAKGETKGDSGDRAGQRPRPRA
ncbi:MAG TPA: DNA recombination/repair protein RecA, partial [Polyangiaceae bacterium]|nr:DNA recombination/repair protein RecA [Polyangiaceae bacterium]